MPNTFTLLRHDLKCTSAIFNRYYVSTSFLYVIHPSRTMVSLIALIVLAPFKVFSGTGYQFLRNNSAVISSVIPAGYWLLKVEDATLLPQLDDNRTTNETAECSVDETGYSMPSTSLPTGPNMKFQAT